MVLSFFFAPPLLLSQTVLETEGLFRISATKRELDDIKAALDKGLNVVFSNYGAHTVAGVLKMWLRELPEPFIPFKACAPFIAAAQAPPDTLKTLVKQLPPLNRRCLHKLMELLDATAKHADSNKMPAKNLGIVFGAVIIKKQGDIGIEGLALISSMYELVTNLIENYSTIFGPFQP